MKNNNILTLILVYALGIVSCYIFIQSTTKDANEDIKNNMNVLENKNMLLNKLKEKKKLDNNMAIGRIKKSEGKLKNTVNHIPYPEVSSLKSIGTQGDSQIHTLCRGKNIAFKLIKEHMENGLDINGKNSFGQTPILLATRSSNLLDIKKLISMGANIHVKTTFGRDALASAFQNKDFTEREKIIKYLLNKEDFSMSDFPGKYLKYMIVNEDNRPYIMEMLPNMKESHYKPNLNILLGYGRGDDEIVDFFMDNGISIDTELLVNMSRSKNVSTKKLQTIIESEYLDINQGSRIGGHTPLMAAIMAGDSEKVEFYLQYGSDLKIKNSDGDDAFELAENNLYVDSNIISKKQSIKIEQLLEKYNDI